MKQTKKNTQYKKWAFRCLICVVVLNIATYYVTLTQVDMSFVPDIRQMTTTQKVLRIVGILTNLLFVAGLVLTIMSMVKKEKKDYQWYTAVIGFGLLLLFFFSLVLYGIFVFVA
ncbi:hypothetical protein NBRC110019_20030 [Neptunitalea chrysea]|uniref:Uncharacterized protein n=1 Tax=Neptunitalea chrysea TaxID=1647581 RepID=A0A9W6B8N2_9FLAO|nr:hypothetical protein [Neptunitalea chrysea]GLB52963.1 hypothetical protein NBRC110019_20030 [Neptunitalea chrysea]